MKHRSVVANGTILNGRYKIIQLLGSGGMGAVYEALNIPVSASVALKETFADDDYLRRLFEREAKLLANLSHEAFPRVIDYFTQEEGCFLVMELVRGEDLAQLLSKRQTLFEPAQVLQWTDQILDALCDLHENNIIHRDIKPSNLKLTPKGRIKLLDFGIAKGSTGDTGALSTVGSMAAATLQYAPLEQILKANSDWYMALLVGHAGKANECLNTPTDARTDLYALGATVYQLLTGYLPVNAPTRALSLWAGKDDTLRPAHEVNPNISKPISDVLKCALELEKDRRPSSAVELRQMFLEAVRAPEVKKPELPTVISGIDTSPATEFETQLRQPLNLDTSGENEPRNFTAPKSVLTISTNSKTAESDSKPPELAATETTRSKPFIVWAGLGVLVLILTGVTFAILTRRPIDQGLSGSSTVNSANKSINTNNNTADAAAINASKNANTAAAAANTAAAAVNAAKSNNAVNAANNNTAANKVADQAADKTAVREEIVPKKTESPAPVTPPKPSTSAGKKPKEQKGRNSDCIFNGDC